MKKKYSIDESLSSLDLITIILYFESKNHEKYIDLVKLFLIHGLLETINKNTHSCIWTKLWWFENLQCLQTLKLFIEYGLDINTIHIMFHPNLLSFLLDRSKSDDIIEFVISHTIIKKENLKQSMMDRNEKYRNIIKNKYIKQESEKLIKNLIEII